MWEEYTLQTTGKHLLITGKHLPFRENSAISQEHNHKPHENTMKLPGVNENEYISLIIHKKNAWETSTNHRKRPTNYRNKNTHYNDRETYYSQENTY